VKAKWGALSAPLAIAIAISAQLAVLRHPEASTGIWIYAAAIAVLLSGSRGASESGWPAAPAGERADLIATALLLVVAAVLRLALLSEHPGVFGDEGERGMEARRILEGARPPLFGYGWWGVPNAYFYLVAGVMKLAGDGLFGLRLLSAVSGVVTVLFVTRAGTLLWGQRVGLTAGALLAVSPVALQFSRLAGESTPTGALWAAGFFFAFRTLRDGLSRDAVLAGVLLGASLYFYAVAKLLLLLLPILALMLLAARRRRGGPRLAALLTLAFAVTFAPLAVTSQKQGEAFAGRYRETSILSPQNRPIAFRAAGVTYPETLRDESAVESVTRHPWR
jgi:4-amino-4-deoxy-L-arabinose transferase-like glycosyltransferase